MTPMFKLGSSDLFKGIITAILASLAVALTGIFQTPGFDLFMADWGSIGHNMLNVSVAAASGYLLKNFFTDANGNFLGKGTPQV